MELDHCGDSAYHLRVLVGLNFLSVRKLTLNLSGASRALAGHRQIFTAVEQGDGKAARGMMHEYLQNVKEDLAGQPATNLVFDEKNLL